MNKIKLIDGIVITFKKLAVLDLQGTPYVITLLRKKKLTPEDVPEKLLSLHDQSGTSVLNVCIERLKEPVSDNDGKTVPRALFLANKPDCELPLHFRKVKEILRIAREDGWSVTHEMISQNLLPKSMMTEEILKLTDASGCAVAYYAAWHNSLPSWAKRRRDILLLGNGKKDYVAHVLAKLGKLPEEMMTEEILKLTDASECTVAYYTAGWDSFSELAKRRRDILLLGNGQGDYVAHMLAKRDKLPAEMMTPDILKLKNRHQDSVAYYAAWNNTFPEWAKRNKDILMLGSAQGDKVAHVLVWRKALPVETITSDILKLQDSSERTILAILISKRCLSPKIMLLPWDEKTKVCEHLLSKEFGDQFQNEEDIMYVKQQIMEMIQKQSLSALSVLAVHDCKYDCKYERDIER